MVGRMPFAKQLTAPTRELEQGIDTESSARWAVEAGPCAEPDGRGGPIPRPVDGDQPTKGMTAVQTWFGIFLGCYLILYSFVGALTGVYGWAVGSLAGWQVLGGDGVKIGGFVGPSS